MSGARPPSLRGTDRVVFLVGAVAVLATVLYALWRVPTIAERSPAGVMPSTSSAPVARLGTPDPAGILWFTIDANSISPSSAVVPPDIPVQIRLRNMTTTPRTFGLRAEVNRKMVQAWASIAGGAEAGESLTLPRGTYVLEGEGQSVVIEAR